MSTCRALVGLLVFALLSGDVVAQVVPDSDPVLDGEPPALVDEVMSQHPRLLFGPDDIERLRAVADSPIGQRIMERFEAYLGASAPPDEPGFLRDATDAQRQGFWRMPTVALHYALTGSERSFNRALGFLEMLLELEDWELGNERNSGMGAANIMIGAALAYDILHDDLEPEFREAFRQKLLHHARWQYYGGHLNRNEAQAYWQQDPHNNHRWHRNAGLALCVLAAYSGAEEEQWLLQQVYDELAFVMRWLPEDGSYHEGAGYQIFGVAHLAVALEAADRAFGTEYLQSPALRNMGVFQLHATTPGLENRFSFGDGGTGPVGGYATALHLAAAVAGDSDVQALMNHAWENRANSFSHFAWSGLLWHDPELEATPIDELPRRGFFPDTGVLFVRDGWRREDAAAMFKACPFGGHVLNQYRNEKNYHYINVAHDDPDANSFVFYRNGGFLAETSRYSTRKQSANHNTILVNGMGQMSRGRPEGGTWTQPAQGNVDMTDMAYITAYREGDAVVIIEGEAAGSYLALRGDAGSRPALARYRRTFIWVEGRYVLVLDDIRSSGEPVEVTWLMQGPELEVIDAAAHAYRLAHDEGQAAFRVAADVALSGEVVTSPADHRRSELGWRQLRLTGEARQMRVASAYDLWDRGELTVTLETADDDHATVRVQGPGVEDTWQWQAAPDRHTASSVVGQREGEVIGQIGEEDTMTY